MDLTIKPNYPLKNLSSLKITENNYTHTQVWKHVIVFRSLPTCKENRVLSVSEISLHIKLKKDAELVLFKVF